jgi:hypothetical protein
MYLQWNPNFTLLTGVPNINVKLKEVENYGSENDVTWRKFGFGCTGTLEDHLGKCVMHPGQYILHFTSSEGWLVYFGSFVGWFSVVFQYAIPCWRRLLLSPVAFVLGAVVSNIFPFQTLSSLCFLYNQMYVLITQLHPQGVWGYIQDSLHLFAVCLCLDFLAEYTFSSTVFGKEHWWWSEIKFYFWRCWIQWVVSIHIFKTRESD